MAPGARRPREIVAAVMLAGLAVLACSRARSAAASPPPLCHEGSGADVGGARPSVPPVPPRSAGSARTPRSTGAAYAGSPSARADGPPLQPLKDVPLPGPAVRFDYQSVDTTTGRLWMAHMNAGTLLAFDTRTEQVVANLPGFRSVHGVLAVPAVGKVYATATGEGDVAVVDAATLRTVARPGPVGYGDGLAYAPGPRRVFVSDESRAGQELVIDAGGDTVVDRVALEGEAGNTLYDPRSGCILVAVQTRQEVVAIDPTADTLVGRYPVPGSEHPHGMALDPDGRLLFVADEGSATLFVLDLATMEVLSKQPVGRGPDVLAFDPELRRLYVAAEAGVVSAFEVRDRDVVPLGEVRIPHAHTVAVDPTTHRVYLPLEDVDGRPVLRILAPG